MKNNIRGKLTELEKLQRMVAVAELYYKRDLNEKQIAETIGCSPTHIGRILKEASEKNIIEININRQHVDQFRQALIDRFGLVDVRLAPYVASYDATRVFIADEAARYFEEIVSGNHKNVGVTGGRTLHRMVESIAPKARKITIYPLTGMFRDLQINYVDSGPLVHLLWTKCMDAADAYWFPLEPIETHTPRARVLKQRARYLQNPQVRAVFRAASNVDLALIGIGPLRKKSSTIKQLKNIGITYDLLKSRGAGGIAGGVWFNKNGKPVIEDYFLSVSLDSLRQMAKESSKRVVVVAGGEDKVQAIRVFLQHGACNVLITDSKTAALLLQ